MNPAAGLAPADLIMLPATQVPPSGGNEETSSANNGFTGLDKSSMASKAFGSNDSATLPASEPGENKENSKITIHIRTQTGNQDTFLVKRGMLMGKIIDKYCGLKSLDKMGVRFLFEGDRIAFDDTPDSLGMENDDMVDLVIAQYGGKALVLGPG